jgi:hypothetical protein
VATNRDLESYANHVRAAAVALWAIAGELRMHAGDLVAEARERPARVRSLYDSLAHERARQSAAEPVGMDANPADAKRGEHPELTVNGNSPPAKR